MRNFIKSLVINVLGRIYNLKTESDLFNLPYVDSIAKFDDNDLDKLFGLNKNTPGLPAPPPEYRTLHGRHYFRIINDKIQVTCSGTPIIDNNIIWSGYSSAPGYTQAATRFLCRKVTINSPMICMWPNHNFMGYGDYLLSLLPRFTVLKTLVPKEDWNNALFILGFSPPNYLIKSLETLGITREQIINRPGTVYMPTADTPIYTAKPPAFHNYCPTKEEFEIVRREFKVNNDNAAHKIFVDRGTQARRQLVKSHVWIMDAFLEKGYEAIDPGTLNFHEQLNLFSSATHLAGVHGAGLSNIYWAKPGLEFLEWFRPEFTNPCFRILTGMLGGHYMASGIEHWHSENMKFISADVTPDEQMVKKYLNLY